MKDPLTHAIIGCAMNVSNALPSGLLERVYENALSIELEYNNIPFERQKQIKLYYRDQLVGNYIADILVQKTVLLELKSATCIGKDHISQTIHYMKATGIRKGLILNFGSRELEFKRLAN